MRKCSALRSPSFHPQLRIPGPSLPFPSPRDSKTALAKNMLASLAALGESSTKDGMDFYQLSPEELELNRRELNRRAFPIAADVIFNHNLNNIFNLTSVGKTSMPHGDEVNELQNFEASQRLDSNLVSDGKISMPQSVEGLRSSIVSQQPVLNIFNSSSFGKISMPKIAFADPLLRTSDELENFGLSHKFIVFKKGSPESPRDIIKVLSLLQVERENLTRLIPNQWTTIPGNNVVVFATFDPDFTEDEARNVVKFIESEFKKPFNVPANFAGMDSAGSTNTNTRSGIEVRFWFNRTTTVIDDLVDSLTKLILKKDSLAGIFNCLKVPMVVARHFIKDAAGVAVYTIEQVFKFYGVLASCLTPESRVWGTHKSTVDKDITSAESWHVTLTYPSVGSDLPKGEFQVEVPTMDGSTTFLKVLFGFPYSRTSEVSKPHITKYKTILCKAYEANGSCGRGSSCTFAHGENDRVEANFAPKRAPLVNTKMCRSVQLGKNCFRHRCRYAHHESELVPVAVQVAAPAQLAAASAPTTLKESAPVVLQLNVAATNVDDILKHGSAGAAVPAVVSRSMTDLEEVDPDVWVVVSKPKANSPVALQSSSRAGITNYYNVLGDEPAVLPKSPIHSVTLPVGQAIKSGADVQLPNGDAPTAPIASIDLSSENVDTLVAVNHLKPILSESLILKHGSTLDSVSDLVSAHPLQKVEHTHIFMAAKSTSSVQCHKCKITFWNERFRCTHDVMTDLCPYVLCPKCHKAHKALLKSPQSIQPATPTAKSPKGGKVTAVTISAPSNGVELTAKTPTISEVSPTPTTPTNTIGAVASKRKNLSPSANGPPVAGDKFSKTSESAVVTRPAMAPLQSSNILSSPSKAAGAMEVSPKLSKNPTLTQFSGQKKPQQSC